jgi:hypothetical protein
VCISRDLRHCQAYATLNLGICCGACQSFPDQSSHSIGEQAVGILLKAIAFKRRRPARNVIIEPKLVARESTAA